MELEGAEIIYKGLLREYNEVPADERILVNA
jgi:hypothetical protein